MTSTGFGWLGKNKVAMTAAAAEAEPVYLDAVQVISLKMPGTHRLVPLVRWLVDGKDYHAFRTCDCERCGKLRLEHPKGDV